MKYAFVIIALVLTFPALSQYSYKNNKQELVRRNDFMKLSGWNFAPGITYYGTRIRNTRDVLYENGDTSHITEFDPAGRIGLYFEVGRHHIFKHAILFPYLDYGIAYKGLRGRESFESEVRVTGVAEPLSTGEGSGEFANHNILAYVNLNNILQLTDYTFIQNSIGLNVDYSIIKNTNKPAYPLHDDIELPRFWAQIHYKLGFGIKMTDQFFIIPSIETSLLNLSPFTNFRPKVDQYMSNYRPLIFSVRLAFLGLNGVSCPPVYDPAGGRTNDPAFQ